MPVVAVTFWSKEALPASELERVAHTVEAEFKAVAGVREVQTLGGPGREIRVVLDPGRLRARGVDLIALKRPLQLLISANLPVPCWRLPVPEQLPIP